MTEKIITTIWATGGKVDINKDDVKRDTLADQGCFLFILDCFSLEAESPTV